MDEAHLFFGRESQVDTMVDKLVATRFLSVVGTSGSGKSSLVNCGLRPALHRGLMPGAGPGWRIAQFRPGSDPIKSLSQALATEGVLFSGYKEDFPIEEIMETYLHQSANGVVEAFRKARLPKKTNLLIVADQFEELFRYAKLESAGGDSNAASEKAIAFVNLLLQAAAEPDYPIYVVITMRSDFLGDCSQFYGLPEAINGGQYLVPRMTRDERRASIAGPVNVGGAEISSVLLTRLVNDVGDNPDQLSILQHALHRTWDCWKRQGASGELGLEHYTAIGGMGEALNKHADEAFDLLETPRKQIICEKFFKALTDLGTDARGIRRPLKLATLIEIAATSAEETAVKEAIEVFRHPSRAFLMPPAGEPLQSQTVIDISHESLMRVWKRLRLWAEEESDSARRYGRLAETAALERSSKAGLWGDPDLQLTLDWKAEREPTRAWAQLYGGDFEAAIDFLQRSQARRDHELAEVIFARRWRSVRPLVIGVPFVLLLIAGVFLWKFKDLKWWLDTFGVDKNLESLVIPAETPVQWPPAEPPQTPSELAGPSPRPVESVVAKTVENSRNEALNVIKPVFAHVFFLAPYVLALFAFNYAGKWGFRRVIFGKILKEVALSSSKAEREKLARQALESAVGRLQTTYASSWRRLGATVLDLCLFTVGFVPAFLGGIYLAGQTFPGADYFFYAPLLILFIAHWLYHATMLNSRRQATLGMLALGIFATDQNGHRLHFGRATARHFTKILSCITLGIGFFMQPFTSKRQTLHDLVPGSVVLVRVHRKRLPWWIVVICVLVAGPVGYLVLFEVGIMVAILGDLFGI